MKVDFTEGKTRLGDGDGKYVDNFHSVGEGQSQGEEEDPTAGGRNTLDEQVLYTYRITT